MTVKQFWQKVRVAERVGEAVLPGGYILVCHTPGDCGADRPGGECDRYIMESVHIRVHLWMKKRPHRTAIPTRAGEYPKIQTPINGIISRPNRKDNANEQNLLQRH